MIRSHSQDFIRERLWLTLGSATLLCMLIFYMAVGAHAFYIVGPAILFFLALTQFPHIYLWMNNIEAEHGPQLQRLLKVAKNMCINDPPHFVVSSHAPTNDNIFFLASGRAHWFIAAPEFLEKLTDQEIEYILRVQQELFSQKVLQRASLLSALQYFLRFFPWTHQRGSELAFYSYDDNPAWLRFLYTYAQRRKLSQRLPFYFVPNALLPVLTNYSDTRYYSLYVFLRDQWLTRTKEDFTLQEDP
ncbi:MAG: hypothetical protein H6623_07020 [Bdellovibrionaceae bacterium]|nr:hypothetical protein [Pseudobdellovibrionaceae bacterium]